MGKIRLFGMLCGSMKERPKILLPYYLSCARGRIEMPLKPFTRRLGFRS
jgi:hypothetical protein